MTRLHIYIQSVVNEEELTGSTNLMIPKKGIRNGAELLKMVEKKVSPPLIIKRLR